MWRDDSRRRRRRREKTGKNKTYRFPVRGWEAVQRRGQAERKRMVVVEMMMMVVLIMMMMVVRMEIPLTYFLG